MEGNHYSLPNPNINRHLQVRSRGWVGDRETNNEENRIRPERKEGLPCPLEPFISP